MKKTKIDTLNLDIYRETLDNGLLVYICPMDKNNAHASIITKYGSDNLEFVPRGKDEFIRVPEGTAHFLEHKMFETENGEDPMTLYSNNGASSNAYTSNNVTRYYFTGASHFYENLDILLNCITNPYFTLENIEKEQGIIREEINSGLDDPFTRIYYLANKNLFVEHAHQYTVAGTADSIGQLTPEILYDCYNTFYHPSNMYMVITGKVDPQETIDYIKKYFEGKKYPKSSKIKQKHYDEPLEVKTKKQEEIMNISNKLLSISYKVKTTDNNRIINNLYLMIYLDTLFSEMSSFYAETHYDKNILNKVSYYIENVDDFIAVYLDVEVLDSEKILTKIDKKLNSKKIAKEDFDLIVKNVLKASLLATESVVGMAHLIVNQELVYGKFYDDFYKIYKNLNFDDYKKFVESLDFSNKTISIIKGFNS